jgi:arabinofuranosyltransferase
MAGVLWLGLDPVAWSKALGVGFSLATLVAVFVFSRWWARGSARSPGWAAAAPALLASCSAFAAWSEGGLETALFTFLMTAAALRQVVELAEEGRLPWSALLVALASLTRPEGLLLFALLGAHRAFHQRRLRPLARWAAVFVAVAAPYWMWRYGYYGQPLPNTYYAKAGPPLWGPGWRYVLGFVKDFQLWLPLLLIALPWPQAAYGGALRSLIGFVAAAWAVYVASVGGDFMALHRFLVPLLPLLALATQGGLASLWARARTSTQRRAALATLITLGAAWAVHNGRLTTRALLVDSHDGIDSIGWLKQFARQTTAIGRYLAAAFPPGTRIATTAAGAIPYYSRLPTLDLLGLNDLYVAHEVPATFGRPGHRKAAPLEYILRVRPRVLFWHPQALAEPFVPSPAEVEAWRARGYSFRSVRVGGLDPPYWSYLEAD